MGHFTASGPGCPAGDRTEDRPADAARTAGGGADDRSAAWPRGCAEPADGVDGVGYGRCPQEGSQAGKSVGE